MRNGKICFIWSVADNGRTLVASSFSDNKYRPGVRA
jgi:hypothetical protein